MDSTLIDLLVRDLENFEVPVPPKLADVLATRAAVMDAANTNVVGDVAAQLGDGTITAANARDRVLQAALDLTTTSKARELAIGLEPTFDQLGSAALRESAEDIIVSLRPVFDEAAAIMSAAREQFGANLDRQAILAAGPGAVAAWKARDDALAVLVRIRMIRMTLARVGYGSDPTSGRAVDASAFIAYASDENALAVANQAMRDPGDSTENLVAAGFDLRLNLADEAAEITAAARRVTHDQERAKAENDPDVQAKIRRGQREIEAWEKLVPTEKADAS